MVSYIILATYQFNCKMWPVIGVCVCVCESLSLSLACVCLCVSLCVVYVTMWVFFTWMTVWKGDIFVWISSGYACFHICTLHLPFCILLASWSAYVYCVRSLHLCFSETVCSLSLACHRLAFLVSPHFILFVSGPGSWPGTERGCSEGTVMSGMWGGSWRRCQCKSAAVVSKRGSALLYPILRFS